MEKETKRIEELLARFFDGETSNAEERELYAWFGRPDVPAHLEQYRPMFGWFGEGMAAEAEQKENPAILPRRPKLRTRIIWTVVAASLVTALLMLPLSKPAEHNPYEGSYVVINGEKITDPAIVGPEVEATLRWLEQEEAYRRQKELEEYLISEILWTYEAQEALKSM